jgi:crossover junction endodeoxyribonuclease RuvC
MGGLAIPCQTVAPAKWKKDMRLNTGKDAARAKAAQIWPASAKEFSRVKDDGKAEACLIAAWGNVTR